LVMENATTRYLKFLANHPNIDNRIPLQYIASHLGITPTQLSRIRKDLKKNSTTQHM
jgi:DNA-binding MarR family transcriptional regulator